MAFERVYMVWDYYDGPRIGLADYNGIPHHFNCLWDDELSNYGDGFVLSPVDAEILEYALEQWAIWLKWDTAFRAGEVPQDSHPGHGGRDARYDKLDAVLKERMASVHPIEGIYRGSFHVVPNIPTPPVGQIRVLEVEWRTK